MIYFCFNKRVTGGYEGRKEGLLQGVFLLFSFYYPYHPKKIFRSLFPKLYLPPPVSFTRFVVENAFKVFNESGKIYLLELEEILQLEKEGDV